jgi:hypothetical protein
MQYVWRNILCIQFHLMWDAEAHVVLYTYVHFAFIVVHGLEGVWESVAAAVFPCAPPPPLNFFVHFYLCSLKLRVCCCVSPKPEMFRLKKHLSPHLNKTMQQQQLQQPSQRRHFCWKVFYFRFEKKRRSWSCFK